MKNKECNQEFGMLIDLFLMILVNKKNKNKSNQEFRNGKGFIIRIAEK